MNLSKATRQELQKHCRGLEKELINLRKKCKRAEEFTVLAKAQENYEEEIQLLRSRIEELNYTNSNLKYRLGNVYDNNYKHYHKYKALYTRTLWASVLIISCLGIGMILMSL